MNDPADHPAIVNPRNAAHTGRKMRLDPSPLFVAQPKQILAHDPDPLPKPNQNRIVRAQKLMSFHPSHMGRAMPKAFKKTGREANHEAPRIARARHHWQLQTAKAKFSEVFRLARTEGPQRITRQGKDGVVMISDELYERLTVKSRQPKSIVEFFRQSPLVGIELDLKRDQDAGRDVEL